MKKILVIEDQDSVRDNIVSILMFENYEVIAAPNGTIGLTKAKEFLPDLIICDIMMPDMSGYEVLKNIRENSELLETPFIFLTAKSTLPDIRYGMNIGADDYITKPFTTEDLLNSIVSRLKRSEAISNSKQKKFKIVEDKIFESIAFDSETGLPGESALESKLKELIHISPNLTLFLIKLENLSYYTIVTNSEERLELIRKLVSKIESYSEKPKNVFRLDFNKFLLIKENIELSDIDSFSNSIVNNLSESIHIHGIDINIKVLIGISNGQSINIDINQEKDYIHRLVENAKTAQEYLRTLESINYLLFTKDLKEKLMQSIEIESSIQKVFNSQEFLLHYQPKIDIRSGKFFGVEALLRYNSKDKGIIFPANFIQYYEKTGLIKELGLWVLRTACEYCVNLKKQGTPISVAVNLSGVQIIQTDFIEQVKEVLEQTGIEPNLLELEITETYLMKNVEQSIEVLGKLKNFGIKISLDDFGTGYSSLAYIRNLPIDTIKIDKKFVDDVHTDSNDQIIVQTIVKMANMLSMDIIAEGVETKEQLFTLATLGVSKIQGYFFSKPIPPSAIELMLKENKDYTLNNLI